ncbi:hypothetical protein H6F71_14620 [Microcoleus sp. FACHB-61]|nr:hypothetical protein [Microcoleus sp. FACHB-61]
MNSPSGILKQVGLGNTCMGKISAIDPVILKNLMCPLLVRNAISIWEWTPGGTTSSLQVAYSASSRNCERECRERLIDFRLAILDGRTNLKSQISNLKSECLASRKFYPTDCSLMFTNSAIIATAKLM